VFCAQGDDDPDQESANVSPHSNAAVHRHAQSTDSAQKLHEKPQAQYDYSGNADDEDEDQCQDAIVRLQDDVSTHYARNGATRADRRKMRVQIKDDMR